MNGETMTPYTVWHFTSPTSGQSVIAVRRQEPNDVIVQHAYQRILWRGMAKDTKHAEDLAACRPAEYLNRRAWRDANGTPQTVHVS